MEHIIRLHPSPFNEIKNSRKIIELRLYDEKRKLLKVGDTIKFLKRPELNEFVNVKITDLFYFNNFKDLINSFPLNYFGSEYASYEELVNSMKIYYSLEEQSKYGVIGIKFILL